MYDSVHNQPRRAKIRSSPLILPNRGSGHSPGTGKSSGSSGMNDIRRLGWSGYAGSLCLPGTRGLRKIYYMPILLVIQQSHITVGAARVSYTINDGS